MLALGVIVIVVGAVSSGSPPSPDRRYRLILQAPPLISVASVAVSPDGSVVAAVADGVRLYDAKSGALLRAIGGAGDRGVAFSPDGRRLAAAGFHLRDEFSTPLRSIPIFDVPSGKRMQELDGCKKWETYAVAFSPDGKLFAAAGVDKQVLVWELATGKLRHRFADQPLPVSALAFSPDGKALASGGGDTTIRVWEMKTGEQRRVLSGHRGWICTIAYSPDGKSIASGSCDWGSHRGHDWPRPEGSAPESSEWRLWDAASGELGRSEIASGRLQSLAFAPDGKALVCGVGTEVRLYNLPAGTPARVVATHHEGVTSVAFTPDGAAILSGSHDHTVKRTDLANGREEWRTPGSFEQVNSVALSDDGSLLATGGGDGRFAVGLREAGAKGIGPGAVRIWDARTGRLLRRLGDPAEQIMAVALSPDGGLVAGGGGRPDGKGVVRLWTIADGSPTWSTADQDAEVLAVAFAPDGSSFASAGADGLIRIRDPQTGTAVRTLPGHGRGATSLAYSVDGANLACGAGDGTAVLWVVRTGEKVRTFRPSYSRGGTFRGDRPITSIALSRDGGTLATCTAGVNQGFAEPVRLWDARTGELKREFSEPLVTGRPMALSPDGSVLATGGKSVKLWDARTGERLRELIGHLKRTQSFAFSANGKRLFCGGSYGTTNTWDVETGKHLVTLFAFPDPLGELEDAWLAYHPDGYYDGSPGIDRFLAWRVDEDLKTPEALGTLLHRPERIAEALKQHRP